MNVPHRPHGPTDSHSGWTPQAPSPSRTGRPKRPGGSYSGSRQFGQRAPTRSRSSGIG